jgi:ElaA protein
MDQWILKHFDDLTPSELYAVLRLRSEVFVVEQNCVYLDQDGKDPLCYHLLGWTGTLLAAYVRLLPPGLSYSEPSIGRVVTSPSYRGKGGGRALMEKALEQLYLLYGTVPVRIGAQQYLQAFYSSLGFEAFGDMYLEDNIPHVEMVKNSGQ